MNEKLISVKKYVRDHKTAIAVGATLIISYHIHHIAIKEHNDFLAEKGLLNEFYTPDREN